jgi:hypothetical protein
MWPLRAGLGLIMVGFAVGGLLFLARVAVPDVLPEADVPAILRGSATDDRLVRIDANLPLGWHVERGRRWQTAGLFTPTGDFAFEVGREWPIDADQARGDQRPIRTVDEFFRLHADGKDGARMERRNGPQGVVAVVRRKLLGVWPEQWIGPPPPGAEQASEDLLVFSADRQVCLRFRMRAADADRLVPVALQVFDGSEVVPREPPQPNPLKQTLKWAGVATLSGCGVLILVLAWFGTWVQVYEGSQGVPVPEPIDNPTLTPATGIPMGGLTRLQFGPPDGLARLGFEPAGWFRLDNFAQLHVGAWRHPAHAAIAFVFYQPGGTACLRIIRRFRGGLILVSSTKLTDLACARPESTYVQVRKTPTAEELWRWHLEAEKLFGEEPRPYKPEVDRITRSPGDFTRGPAAAPAPRTDVGAEGEVDPMELFMEVLIRSARFLRSRRLWLLRLNPFRELWLMYHLHGMPIERQVEEGWAVSPRLE